MFQNFRTARRLQALAASGTTPVVPAAPVGAPTSQARVFAAKYTANAGINMAKTLEKIAERAERITKVALGVSIPHQIGYILVLAIPTMHWSLTGSLEALTMILLALGVPYVTDMLILSCVETIGAQAASDASKRKAWRLMLIPVLASGTVNFLAPSPMLLKILSAFLVTMVPMAQSLRFIRPDFGKMERAELEVAAEVSQPAPPVEDTPEPVIVATRPYKVGPQELAARKAALYGAMNPKEKSDFTKKYRARQAAKALAVNPVSPGAWSPTPSVSDEQMMALTAV